jgi:polysaccharide biosynthesis PFTS motif protein
LGPFVTQLAKHSRHNQSFLHPEGTQLNLDGITIDTNSGRVALTTQFLLRAGLDFTLHWLHALISILRMGTGTPCTEATLVFGIGVESLFYGLDDQRFVEYCNQGPITPLAKAKRLIVQHVTRTGSYSDSRVGYARHPFAQLASETKIHWYAHIKLLGSHLLMPARYVWAIIRCQPLALLSRDFALGPLLAALERSGMIEAVVFTNSNYSIQPMWARAKRSYETHMVWYSQNSIPLILKGDDFAADLPNYRHMYVDVHWVWTQGFRCHILNRFGHMQRVEVVGPVTWYLPEPPAKRLNGFNIAAFDVTPISDNYAESIGLVANYYNPVTAIGFLNGLLKSAANLRETQGADSTIQLKHKRSYSPTHDQDYIELVSRLQGQGEINLIPFDINIYSFISDSDVVVVIPNSSPAYIASSLGVPSIYFDPTMELQPTFEQMPGVLFASGTDALCEQLINIYRLKKANNKKISKGV